MVTFVTDAAAVVTTAARICTTVLASARHLLVLLKVKPRFWVCVAVGYNWQQQLRYCRS